jgi:hypothetical protein
MQSSSPVDKALADLRVRQVFKALPVHKVLTDIPLLTIGGHYDEQSMGRW